jgi:protoporphyrinogen oxidase
VKNIVILGGGLTGLVLAEQLQGPEFNVIILEKENHAGGMCVTNRHFVNNGNESVLYDLGPHKFASFDADASKYFIDTVGTSLELVDKSSKIYLKGKHLAYPISMVEIMIKMPIVGLRCALGYLGAFAKSDGETYDKYMRKRFGDYVYEMVFEGYARKIWGEPSELDAELGRVRMSAGGVVDLVADMFRKNKSHSFGFFYYCTFGIGQFINKLTNNALGKGVAIKTNVSDISIKGNEITFACGDVTQKIAFDTLVSTIPMADLNTAMDLGTDEVYNFGYRDLKLYYYLIDKSNIEFSDTWRFFPEEGVVFNRISRNWSDKMVPNCTTSNDVGQGFRAAGSDEGKICICVELTKPGVDIDIMDKQALDYLGLKQADIESMWAFDLKGAYPICHAGFERDVRRVLDEFADVGVYCIGRHACHNYNNMDHSIKEAIDLAALIKSGGLPHDWIDKMAEYKWRIVD